MNENIKRLLNDASRQMTATSEVDHAGDRALIEAFGITDFDLQQLNQGRLTGSVAALHNALAELRTIAGVDEEPGSRPWIEQAQADGDLSRTAKQTAGWLERNGDGEIGLKAIGSEFHISKKAVREALGNSPRGATWICDPQ